MARTNHLPAASQERGQAEGAQMPPHRHTPDRYPQHLWVSGLMRKQDTQSLLSTFGHSLSSSRWPGVRRSRLRVMSPVRGERQRPGAHCGQWGPAQPCTVSGPERLCGGGGGKVGTRAPGRGRHGQPPGPPAPGPSPRGSAEVGSWNGHQLHFRGSHGEASGSARPAWLPPPNTGQTSRRGSMLSGAGAEAGRKAGA